MIQVFTFAQISKMTSYTFKNVTPDDLKIVQILAEKIWKVVYPPIIGHEQVEYMLEKMYSIESLEDQIGTKGHQIYLLQEDSISIGFLSFSLHFGDSNNRTRLHKLYLLPDQHGKGLGKMMLEFVQKHSEQAGDKGIELNVNKMNPAFEFYAQQGFEVEKAVVLEIGHGYVMDDYVMVRSHQL